METSTTFFLQILLPGSRQGQGIGLKMSDIEDYGHLFTRWGCWTWGVDEDDDGRNSPIALADLGSHIDAQSHDGSRHPNHSSEDEKTKLGHFLLAFQHNFLCVLSLKRFGADWSTISKMIIFLQYICEVFLCKHGNDFQTSNFQYFKASILVSKLIILWFWMILAGKLLQKTQKFWHLKKIDA